MEEAPIVPPNCTMKQQMGVCGGAKTFLQNFAAEAEPRAWWRGALPVNPRDSR